MEVNKRGVENHLLSRINNFLFASLLKRLVISDSLKKCGVLTQV